MKTGACGISCQQCSISQLCLPFSLNGTELDRLDEIIERKKPQHKNDVVVTAGRPLTSLFAVRSGSFKSYTLSDDGVEQITAFHLPGDLIGFDAISSKVHQSHTCALETSMLCEVPFDTLNELSSTFPKLGQQVMRLMSGEISQNHEMMMQLNQRSANERLAYFLHSLSVRFGERGLSSRQFRLSMTRADIGNYLGLTVETISRLLTRFQKAGLIEVSGKYISLLSVNLIADCDRLFNAA